MTNKDFELIAEILQSAFNPGINGLSDPNRTAQYLAWEFADRFGDEDPNFDHDNFLALVLGSE